MHERINNIRKVLLRILFLNLLVSALKCAWGLISGSNAMLADGIHSLTDGSSNIISLVAMRIASKPLDDNHPYGHHKYESFASAIIGVMLIFVAGKIAINSFISLIDFFRIGAIPQVQVTATSFAVMIITLCINIFVVNFERKKGRVLTSDVLISDAKHTLSDIWVTSGVIVALILVKLGFSIADSVVGIIVSLAIFYAAYEVFKNVNTTFSDEARLDPNDVISNVNSFEGVSNCHSVRTRGTGAYIYMDLSIHVDPNITIQQGHDIATKLEVWLLDHYDRLEDVVIHLEPDGDEDV